MCHEDNFKPDWIEFNFGLSLILIYFWIGRNRSVSERTQTKNVIEFVSANTGKIGEKCALRVSHKWNQSMNFLILNWIHLYFFESSNFRSSRRFEDFYDELRIFMMNWWPLAKNVESKNEIHFSNMLTIKCIAVLKIRRKTKCGWKICRKIVVKMYSISDSKHSIYEEQRLFLITRYSNVLITVSSSTTSIMGNIFGVVLVERSRTAFWKKWRHCSLNWIAELRLPDHLWYHIFLTKKKNSKTHRLDAMFSNILPKNNEHNAIILAISIRIWTKIMHWMEWWTWIHQQQKKREKKDNEKNKSNKIDKNRWIVFITRTLEAF